MTPTSSSRVPRRPQAETEQRHGRRVLAQGLYNFFDVWAYYRKHGWTTKPGGPLAYDHFYIRPGVTSLAGVEGEDFVYGEAALVNVAVREKIFGEPPPPPVQQPPPVQKPPHERQETESDRSNQRQPAKRRRKADKWLTTQKNGTGGGTDPIALSSDSDVRHPQPSDVLSVYSSDDSGALRRQKPTEANDDNDSEHEWFVASDVSDSQQLASSDAQSQSQTSPSVPRPRLRTTEFVTPPAKSSSHQPTAVAATSTEKRTSGPEPPTTAPKVSAPSTAAPPRAVASTGTPHRVKCRRKSVAPQRRVADWIVAPRVDPTTTTQLPSVAHNPTTASRVPTLSGERQVSTEPSDNVSAPPGGDSATAAERTTPTVPLSVSPVDSTAASTVLLVVEGVSFPSRRDELFRVHVSARDVPEQTDIVVEDMTTREQWTCTFEAHELVGRDESSRQVPNETVLEALVYCLRSPTNAPVAKADTDADALDRQRQSGGGSEPLFGKVDLVRDERASTVSLRLVFPCYDFWEQERRFRLEPVAPKALLQQLVRELAAERQAHATTRCELETAVAANARREKEGRQLRTFLRSFKEENAQARQQLAELQKHFRELQQAYRESDVTPRETV